MKYFLSYVIVLWAIADTRAQTVFKDTLLNQFDVISHIFPFENQTFLLAGKKGNVRLMMTNDYAEEIWTLDFADFTDTRISKCEINYEEGDTTIHLLIHPYQCDIIPPGVARLFTIGMDGTIRDTMYIPYEYGPDHIQLLSGNPEWPRYALFRNTTTDSHYVDLYYLDGRIESLLSLYFNVLSIDINTFGSLYIQRWGHWTYRKYSQVNGKYEYAGNGVGSYSGATKLKSASNGAMLFYEANSLTLLDSMGKWIGAYPLFNMYLNSVEWKAPYFYIQASSEDYYEDTLYILDLNMDLIYKDTMAYRYPYFLDYAVLNERLYKVGYDFNYFGGHIESEDLFTHEGPTYYDVELLDFEIVLLDTAYYSQRCRPFFVYSLSKAQITIRNNSQKPVSNVMVSHGYPFDCCYTFYWDLEIENMDLLPGETKSYNLENIELFRSFPFYRYEDICLDIFKPDLHADDHYENNSFCLDPKIIFTQGMEAEAEVRHYPDPVHDNLRFISSALLTFDISIYDFDGRHVLSATSMSSTDNSVDVSMLPPGMYLLQYHFLESGRKKQTRFVKI